MAEEIMTCINCNHAHKNMDGSCTCGCNKEIVRETQYVLNGDEGKTHSLFLEQTEQNRRAGISEFFSFRSGEYQ